jgi:hypothetical protein
MAKNDIKYMWTALRNSRMPKHVKTLKFSQARSRILWSNGAFSSSGNQCPSLMMTPELVLEMLVCLLFNHLTWLLAQKSLTEFIRHESFRLCLLQYLYLRTLYVFFWVIPQHLNFICQRFRTLCLFHLHRQVDLPTCLWRWNKQSVPKIQHIEFRRQGITQKKAYK